MLEQARRKEQVTSEELNELRSNYELLAEEAQRVKEEVKFKNDM